VDEQICIAISDNCPGIPASVRRTLFEAFVIAGKPNGRLRDTTGYQPIRDILAFSPSVRTIVLTSFEGDLDIERALATGAKRYVVKGMVREELLEAIRARPLKIP
jgi:DNA-binding NarL/FixJ family response regulator